MAPHDDDSDLEGYGGRRDNDEAPTVIEKDTVSSVKWQKPGNDWKILKMASGSFWKGVVGEAVGKGWIIEAVGRWVPARDRRYDDEFEIVNVKNAVPSGKAGLETWLMDRLPDIGEKRASDLVKRFGESLFETIDKHPEQLIEIRGITEERSLQIQKAYKKYAHELKIVPQLVDLGIDYMDAQKAAKLPRIMEILQEDPFELMDLPGFSFQKIKDFVLRPGNPYGMAADDPRVVRAYVQYMLDLAVSGDIKYPIVTLRDGGNCFLKNDQLYFLLKNYRRAFGGAYADEELEKIVSDSPRLVWFRKSGSVMLQTIAMAEANVAAVIQSKLALRSGQFEVLPFEGTRLDQSQKIAASALCSLPIAIMTGGPGTGKTTTLKAALDVMEAHGERVKLASPTGKAAKRMVETTGRPAQTIHKLLEWGPMKDEFGNDLGFGFRRNEENPIDADVVVLDETSMLDIELASSFFAALGGARVCFIGDEDQLPPVGPGQTLTDMMKKRPDGMHVVPTFRLTNTYRQAADSWVIDNAKRIVQGQIPSLKNQSDFQFLETDDVDKILHFVGDIYEESKAKGQLEQLQVLCPMKKPGAGASTFEINNAVQLRLNPNSRYPDNYPNVTGGTSKKAGQYQIFEGDKIIFTKNVADLGLVNGDTGFVEQIIVPTNVMETTMLLRIDGLKNPNRDDGLFEVGGDNFKHVLLAYAITIHKSQGSEWKEVVVVMDKSHGIMLKRNLLYTAVTRTSRFLRIVGQRSAVEQAARSAPSNLRQTLLFERLAARAVS